MSLVGNFAFNNFDRTAQAGGPGSPNAQRRSSFFANEDETSTHLAVTRTKSRHQERATSETTLTAQSPQLEKSGAVPDDSSSTEEDDRVTELARLYTRKSTYSHVDGHVFDFEPDSVLDPASENFKPKAWIRSMLKLRDQDGDKFRDRTAGVSFRNLSAHGFGSGADYQQSVGNFPLQFIGAAKRLMGAGKQQRVDILRNFDGLVKPGEMLVVLGPPGSGCSTFLKTIAGETHGYNVDKESQINYQGISFNEMHKKFRGEVIYTAEQDVHFPQMTVGDTLYFAARARAPRNIPGGINKKEYAEHLRDVIMATFGIRHTINTKVGNDFVRGVSGGERKRVSIAEAALSGAPLQCWDNSTRGLDSANAIEFCKTLKISSDLTRSAAAVAIYQAPQAAYDIFDKAIVLYEGRQIYFGDAKKAKDYFNKIGFECPDRQTAADFLTSMTSPSERVVRKDFDGKAPRTPDEFASIWKNSDEYKAMIQEIEEFENQHPVGGEDLKNFKESRKLQAAKRQREASPYTLSYGQQIRLCLWRGFRRLAADPSLTFTQLFGNFAMALIIGSVFYNLNDDTGSFYSRGALLFFAILINAFGSALEILTLYAQRPIVEKHTRYALYHPSAESYASMLTDMPYKLVNAVTFNIPLYFLTNLRREPGPFFFFLLISFFLTLTMSMMFRTIGSVSRTLQQALTPAAVLILAIVIYTGFAIPVNYMLGWARWINYLDPVAFGFEALMINEFHGRDFPCASIVPTYGDLATSICSTVGAVAGQDFVNGETYINTAYSYYHAHKWRNFGILWAFMFGLLAMYLAASEFISAKKSKGEVLVFRRGQIPAAITKGTPDDPEAAATGDAPVTESKSDVAAVIQKQTAVFQWRNVCYDIKIKNEERRILDNVDGWVKPGTLTALMGVSGAGKTTLLDVLATRVTMGVITGDMLVDGRQRDDSFQRKTGYVQQQDLHLSTSTVREALNFSAILRQPKNVPVSEKKAYVEEIIKLLEMESYADAVVGVPGEGLNVEQRKRLTIGVELSAKPELLLFLDEPTSGLDSQTSWSILSLLEKLKDNGQAILCTIHQPSAMLFQRFDRLMFLAKGGRTVYFGEVGESSEILTKYFERNGAHPCPPDANPAEWMLEVIGAAPGSHTDIDWPKTWRASEEYKAVHAELDRLEAERPQAASPSANKDDKESFQEFAAPFWVQYVSVQKRVFQQYWRTPSYIYSKLTLTTLSALFIGFSFFRAQNSQQGLQNQMFGIFMLMTIFGQLVQQIMPLFVTQRDLYEVRERPSKTYSWKAFILSNIIAEVPWNLVCSVLMFVCWYYLIGLWRNAEPSDSVHERGALMWLIILAFLMFTSTFAHMCIAGIATAETGGNIANLIFSMSLIFCGVLATPEALPGFWIFMYRVSPFTYIIECMLATAVADTTVTCATNEYLVFNPPASQTCGTYMAAYIQGAGGYLQNPDATTNCSFCQVADTNAFLAGVATNPDNKWRDFGIMWAYIFFNVAAALVIYWLVRMPKNKKSKKDKTDKATPPRPNKEESQPKKEEV